MPSLTDKPLARANEHLASARYAEAAGAFRAVLHIDPTAFQAHFGLADALVGKGQRAEAVEGLVEAAEACNATEDHAAALTLYGKALSIDPSRLELHLDVAMAEAALGREDSARARLENLAETYMQAGRTDEAAEMYRFLASWEQEEEEEEDDEDDDGETDLPAPVAPGQTAPRAAAMPPAPPPSTRGVPQAMPTTETVVVPTILITPDGELLQLPVGAQASETPTTKTGETVPPALIEAVRSTPIDLDEDTDLHQVEGTVVAFPPPPPELSEEAKAAGAAHSRADLEAAVAAAMENLALLEEEDETLVMQRPLLPKKKKLGSGPGADRGAESKLRLRPAPRPRGATPPPMAAASGPSRAPGRPEPRPRVGTPPPGGARPPGPPPRPRAATPPPGAARPPGAPGRPRAATPPPGRPAPAPARPGRPPPPHGAPGPRPGPRPHPAGRPPPPAGAARPAPAGKPVGKPVRPNNPLVERLRRRAGLQRDTSRAARPAGVGSRATESIAVRDDDDPERSK